MRMWRIEKLEKKWNSHPLNQYPYQDARGVFMENQDLSSYQAY